ncbi:MAG: rhodanese-like domain-containing protein [Myxococcales bacterium]|nr:rhodanese-like domain-containing protein [Myxococcales bacterium]
MPSVLRIPLIALALALVFAGVGLGVNKLRGALPLVAPLPYESDCPEKIDTSPTVSAARAIKLLTDKAVAFIDVREEEAFKRQHLPGARSMPMSFTMPPTADEVAPLKKYRAVVVYCDTPEDRMARMQAERLRKHGLSAVKVLAGGIGAWRKAAGVKAPVVPKGSGDGDDDGDDDDPLSKKLGTGTGSGTGTGTGSGTGTAP